MRYSEQIQRLGHLAKVMLELNLTDPKNFNSEIILNHLFNEVETLNIKLDLGGDDFER